MSAAAPSKKAPAGNISRTAAVTKALVTLGKDAMPMQIKGFIKDKFGVEMSNNVVSTYKSKINGQTTKSNSAPAAKNEPAPKQQVKSALTTGSNGKAGGIELADIQAVKNLVGRVGPDQLKTLIDL